MMPSMLQPGERFEDYEIVGELGSGGFATVYEAVDLGTAGRPVALKVIHEYLAYDPQRFEREVAAIARVEHAHVVPIYRSGQAADGQLFIAMRLIKGRALREHFDDRDLELDEMLGALEGVAAAIDACHADGVFHRDIKPGNVMVASDGRGVLADFGIAKGPALNQLTDDGLVRGTADYLAPEMFTDVARADEKTDLYAFGVVVYEAFTGALPMPSTPGLDGHQRAFAIAGRHARKAPVRRPSELNPVLEATIDAPILAALEYRPERRPDSATEYLEKVLEVAAALDLHESPTTKIAPSRRRIPVALRRLVAVAGGVVALGVAGLLWLGADNNGEGTAEGQMTVTQSMRFPGQDRTAWKASLDARPGDVVEWKVTATNNTKQRITDVVIGAAPPRGATVIDGSVMLYNATNPDGIKLATAPLSKGRGYRVGDYVPDANVLLVYTATLPDKLQGCAAQMQSYGDAASGDNKPVRQLSEVVVRKSNCPPEAGYYPPRKVFRGSCQDATAVCGSADGPVFNSFVGTPSYGDQRAFLDARRIDDTEPGSYADSLRSVNRGERRLVLRMYVNNNADPETNSDGLGLARNTRVRLFVPKKRADGVVVYGYITADNARQVVDSASFSAELPFRLRYRPGTAVQYRNSERRQLSDTIVTSGAPIGDLPGGFADEVVVQAKFDVLVG